MPNLLELPCWDEQGRPRVAIETPRGSAFTIRYDSATQVFTFQRPLEGLRYPYDWGFVPGTLAEDGDPLDALVMHDDATWPGALLLAQPIAVLMIRDRKPGPKQEVQNDRIIALPSVRSSNSASELSAEKRCDLEQFFQAAGEQAGKEVRILGWGDEHEARAAIEQTRRR